MEAGVLREKLATSTRILAMQGVLGLFGHVSIFDPDTQRVFMSPGFGSDKATTAATDVLVCDLAGKVVDGKGRLPIEWPIHTVLHGVRSDALSVAHLHSPYATLHAIAKREFRPVTLQGTLFADGLPLYTKPQLIKEITEGEKLVELIGSKRGALLRGHGVVVVGTSIEETIYAALVLEDDCRKAMQAVALGELNTFDPVECREFGASDSLQRRAERAWGYLQKIEARWDRQPGTGQVFLA